MGLPKGGRPEATTNGWFEEEARHRHLPDTIYIFSGNFCQIIHNRSWNESFLIGYHIEERGYRVEQLNNCYSTYQSSKDKKNSLALKSDSSGNHNNA